MDRDVKLVISATDQASKATEAVRSALVALQEAQQATVASSDQSSSSLDRFGGALASLQQSLRGRNVGDQLEQQFNTARAAAERLSASVDEARQDQERFSASAVETANRIDQERAALVALQATLAKEIATRNALRAARNAANRAEANANLRGGASAEQVESARAAQVALEKQEAAVDRLRQSIKTTKLSITALGREEGRLATQANIAGEAIEKQGRKLIEARVNVLKLGQEAGRTEEALKDLAAAANRELRLEVGRQARTSNVATAATSGSQENVDRAAASFRQAERAAEEYQTSLGATAARTMELRAESDRLEAAFNDQLGLHKALQAEANEQAQTLRNLRAISQETANDVSELTSKQARFAAEQQRGQAAVEKIRASISRYQGNLAKASAQTARTASEQMRLSSATKQAALGTNTLSNALRRFFGEGKRALSVTQRLRGQVLSLATQYVGFFAVFQGIGAVVNSVQQLEGATNSLAAVFDGDFDAVNGELDFLRRNADRLGIGFGQLSDDYTKFAAATKDTPIQDETRAIFIRVAEAGRVLNLTADQMSGTLTALSQIASKGTVSMEELRQQLGDRLPGALQIMAAGVGVSTDELIKLIETGQLSSTALVGFAGELERRFGGQLEGSLASLNAEIGRMANALFESQIAFANGGFLESFTMLIREATETLQSADFQAFLQDVGAAFGVAFKVAGAAIRNFDLIIIGLTAFLTTKALPIVVATGVSFTNLAIRIGTVVRNTGLLVRAAPAATTATSTMGRAAQTAAIRVGLVGTALKAAFASTGIGLAIVAVTTVMAALSTQANDTQEALTSQQNVVDALRNAHDNGANSAEDYAEALGMITAAEARQNVEALQKEVQSLNRELTGLLSTPSNTSTLALLASGQFSAALGTVGGNIADRVTNGANFDPAFASELRKISDAYLQGAINAEEFARATDVAAAAQDLSSSQNDRLVSFIQKTEEAKEAQDNLGTGLQITALKAAEVREELGLAEIEIIAAANATDALGASLANAAVTYDDLQGALEEISKGVPALAAELKKTQELEALGKTLDAVGLSADLEMLNAEVERYARLAALTANIPIIGDATKTRLEQLQGILSATKARIEAINNPQTRSTRTKKDPFAEARKRLEAAIQDDTQQIAIDKLEREGDALGAALQERANTVADIVASAGNLSAGQAAQLEELGAAYRQLGIDIFNATQAEEAREGLASLAQVAVEAQNALSIAQAGDTVAGRALQFEIELTEELRDLRMDVAELSLTDPAQVAQAEQALATIERTKRATFELSEAQRALSDLQQESQNSLSALNDLTQHRAFLVEQLKLAIQQGNDVDTSALQARLNGVDMEITMARDRARELLEKLVALGAPGALEALERLNAKVVETQQVVAGTQVSLLQVATTIADNLSGAVSGFAEAIASGESPIKALGNAVRQFASDTLIEIGRVIARALIMQAVLGALGFAGFGGGTGAGNLISGVVAHEGRTGNKASNRSRSIPASSFIGAPRFHEGRTGLSTGEMAAIIKTDEDVLTRDNPFHSSNLRSTVSGLQGQGGGGESSIKIVNVIDSADMLEAALADTPGQRVMVNHIRRNSEEVNAALDG